MTVQSLKKPFNFVIFGASGDLAKIKLFPALYELALQKRLPQKYLIMGFARSRMSDAEFRKSFHDSIVQKYAEKTDKKVLAALLENLKYHAGEYDRSADFAAMAEAMRKVHKKPVETVAFFSVPPGVYHPIIENLARNKKAMGSSLKIILEKPLGDDEKSARELFHFVTGFFDEKDVFLLDHYLGKVPVQSILPLRFNNTILNVLLKGNFIANIQINALENLGIEERAGYFENVGIVKDMVQSHLLQILALITMSIPIQQNHKAIKREKMHILSSLRYGSKECAVVLGQYKSYRRENGVAKNSGTPTFVAIRGHIDLEKWYGVPFYIRTGKKMDHKHTYITIEFQKPSLGRERGIDANRLIIELAPEEKIQIRLLDTHGKMLKGGKALVSTDSLACEGGACLPEHARLILDAFAGDQTYFISFEEVIASWQFIDRIMERIRKDKIKPLPYADGGEGPEAQHALPACDHFKWYDAHTS